MVTTTTTVLGQTVATAVDTQDVVQVSFQGQNRLAIRSRLLKNLAGGGTQLVTTYRVFIQDSVTRTIQLIGYIDQSGNEIVTAASTLLPGEVTLSGTWNTVSRLLTSVLTTTYNVVNQGNISVSAGSYAGFSFSTSQLALPSLSLELIFTSEGWVCGPIGNILRETKLSVGVLNSKEIEIELTSTNVE